MHRRAFYRTGPLLAVLIGALALASCGGGAQTTGGRPDPPIAPEKTTATTKTGKGEAAGCQAQLGEFVARMNDLRNSLLAGLSYAEYVVRVKAVRDAYEAVPIEKLSVDCLDGPAADAEDAFNQYLRAANAWGECAGTEGCAASEIEGGLQRRWRLASKSLDQAQKG